MKNLFNSQLASVSCLVFAIVVKICLYLHFFQFEGDKLFQAIAARNMVEGNGLTYQFVNASDLSQEIFDPLNRWPPGYSVLVAVIYAMIKDLKLSSVIIDVGSIVLFFITLRKTLRLVGFENYIINILVLLNGVLIPIFISKPTDMLSLTMWVLCCFLTLRLLNGDARPAYSGLLIGLANAGGAMLRYLFIPAAVVIPGILLLYGFRQRDKALINAGTISMVITVLAVSGLFLFQELYSGSATYVMPMEKGWYWQNLLEIYPFFLDAFTSINFAALQLQAITNIDYTSMMVALKNINLVLLILAITLFAVYSLRYRVHPTSKWDFFVTAGAWSCIVMFAVLLFLSVTRSAAPQPPRSYSDWTFVGDGRYYALPMLLLPIIAARFLFTNNKNKGWPIQSLRMVFFLFVALELTHTSYFLIRRFQPLQYEGKNVLISKRAERYLEDRIHYFKTKKMEIVFTGQDETFANWGVLHRVKGLHDSKQLINAMPQTTKPTVMFVLFRDEARSFYSTLSSRVNIHPDKKIDGLNIYTYFMSANE